MASSWFSLDKITGDLSAKVQSAASKVQSAASKVGVDDELIQKLTLRTPELVSERERIDEEERRKETVRDTLAELLPWETRDEEREILVEDCKESILALSTKEDTFTTPFALPGGSTLDLVRKEDSDDKDKPEEEEKASDAADKTEGVEGDGEGKKKSAEEEAADAAVKAAEVEAKVAKLSPLPPLLEDFDLDTHVGLIQRLFEVDQNLVEMHADLSGAGEREMKFWKNYFFHCAYARYEAGLSIDEIWAILPPSGEITPPVSEGGGHASLETSSNHGEETVTFEPSSPVPDATATSQQATQVAPTETPSVSPKGAAAPITVPEISASNVTSGGPALATPATGADAVTEQVSNVSDYEVVNGSGGGVGEEDLDDLEAEIARELEE